MRSERQNAVATARHLLEAGTADSGQICHAIVEIAKPYDAEIIKQHAPLIASFLDHPDSLIRHQAVWYLGSWGHLPTYVSQIVHAAENDPDSDNRAFAARSAGSILKHHKKRDLAELLLRLVEDDQQETEVRLSAYSGLLYAWNRPDDFGFLTVDKTLADVDRDFVAKLHAWTCNEREMPPVTPRRGILSSLFHAWRINHASTSSTSSKLKQGNERN